MPPLTRISIQIQAPDAERATNAFTAAGIPNSVTEWTLDAPYEEAFGTPAPTPQTAQVAAYIPTDRADKTATALQQALQTAWHPAPPPQITRTPLKPRNWLTAWHDHFDIIRIPAPTPIIIRPPHKHYKPRKGEIVIDLSPGLAFGTGQHQSTRLALKLLSQADPAGKTVLDLGTGSGILATAAAKLGAAQVHAVDIDPLAVAAARETARRNGVADRVTVTESSIPPNHHYDLVLANLTADLLQHLAQDLAAATNDILIASGFVVSRLDAVHAALTAHMMMPAHVESEDEWRATLATRSNIDQTTLTGDPAQTLHQ